MKTIISIILYLSLIPLGSLSAGQHNQTLRGEGFEHTMLRDLEADRPDATESPRTVDAGYFQLEMSFLGYSRNKVAGDKFESWSWAETNLKYGLNDSMDLQLIFAPHVRERSKVGGVSEEVDGFSDVTLRLKYNLWGNDGGSTAFAVFPYIKIPSGSDVSNDEWEGGVILPWALDLHEGVSLGLQAEFARVWDDGSYDLDFLHTAVIGFDVSDYLGIYIEYLGISGDHPYEAYASGGLTWAFADYFQWDAGAVFGINEAAEDLTTFAGFTVKF